MKKQEKIVSLNDKKNRYLVFDCETIHSGLISDNGIKQVKDIIEASWQVLDQDGQEIIGSKKGFLVQEFWEDKDYLLSNDYYEENEVIFSKENFALGKIKKWQRNLDKGTLQVRSWGGILKQLGQDIKDYNVSIFCAYNGKFDRQAIVSTSELIPYKTYCSKLWQLDYLDIMLIVETFAKEKSFERWATNHNAISPKGNYQCKAETLFRYISNNNEEMQTKVLDSINWSETHIALEDIECESAILRKAISVSRRKRQIRVVLNKNGSWQSFNKIIKDLKNKILKKQMGV